ncbi:hypothetical protein AGABI2DRAFT_192330 [Agaricus bisporus var. bisporus H97]|uniref:hypothetical protein n=1 Tax=Agaricus bisporus var. bisporus (strain H97 / ATCC MYA-4626 / FGSC 10389) TaxID=936046 RepID=UPI00029F5FAD|nr:hypothetical protein AGABI2DRAFT_192330 [Agaricus bisporus var. bisporus H97]EKV47064.1 hypothetical protein AGABI2DRAFT_192330 [Agaricus bisporus var. bisporus H97]
MTIPRVSSRRSLEKPLLPLHSSTRTSHSLLPMSYLTALLHPQKSRQRTMLLSLVSLFFLTAYVFLVHCTDAGNSLTLWRPEVRPASRQLSIALDSIRHSGLAAKSQPAAQIQLSSDQELAAISNFLSSLPQNQIPSFVDPTRPIDPELILDFDTRSSRATQEVQVMAEDVWSKNPVFLYSKRYSPASREVKAILDSYHLKPLPTIIDVDLRDDADVLTPTLNRLTSVDNLPVLIVAGKTVGTVEDIRKFEADGTLRQMIAQSGAVINEARKNKH